MKVKYIFYGLVVLAIAGIFVEAQDDEEGEEIIAGPDQIFAFTDQRYPTSALIGWSIVANAQSYILRIYRDDVLYQELRNLLLALANVTGLETGTNYSATVTAIVVVDDEEIVETAESAPRLFETPPGCDGGRVYVPCSAHCVSTCDDPDPVCARICVPGCGCPRNLPMWYQGGCIPRVLCPPPTGAPVVPTNLQVDTGRNARDVIVAWDPIEEAANYTVRVRLANSDMVLQTISTTIPLVSVKDLDPGAVYVFSVTVNLASDGSSISFERNALLPPSNIVVSAVTESSFRVQWAFQGAAARHVFYLYDSDQTTLLYSNDKIAGTIIAVESLAPGTTYYFSVASARNGSDPGISSTLQAVRTQGTPADTDDYHSANIMSETAMESTTTPTTPTTTTKPLTSCLEEYNSVEAFYTDFPLTDRETGPKFPNCNDQGLYVTRYCTSSANTICYCISADNGEKIRGSDFGGSNSAFELDCDQIGMLNAQVSGFRAMNVRSSSLVLMWDPVDSINGYVIVIDNGMDRERTRSVNGNSRVDMMMELLSGQQYTFEIFAVNSQGWSGPVSSIQVSTLFVDTPENLRITETTENSATVSWDHSAEAEEYEVILKIDVEIVLTVTTTSNSYTFTDLSVEITYTVCVSAVTRQYLSDDEAVVHRSEEASIEVSLQCELPPLDLLFLVDSSANTGFRNLQLVKDLTQEITSGVPPLDPATGTRVAAVKYNVRVRTSFSFSRLNRTRNALLALGWLSYNGGRTRNISRALNYIRQSYFDLSSSSSIPNRPRPNALAVVIMFVVGEPDDLMKTEMEAGLLRGLTNVIAVGVTGESNENLLTTIASRPDLVVLAPSFEDLPSMNKTIVSKFCTLL